ncbi:MAG: hypothetical protein HY289_12295 [Planctomycetes bacterium]|nr:hypothetical protein [Planctomycetota bacterium]
MKTLTLTLSTVLVFAAMADAGAARRKSTERVGEVIIVGNVYTQDRVIRQALTNVQPGQVLDRRQVRLAERKLARLGLFQNRPTVQVLGSPGPFKDILVKVEETTTRSWTLEPGLNAIGRPIVSLVLVDRNFDPFRFPTSWSDITEGHAFRGGGERVRIEIARLNVTDGSVELVPGSLLQAWTNGFRY